MKREQVTGWLYFCMHNYTGVYLPLIDWVCGREAISSVAILRSKRGRKKSGIWLCLARAQGPRHICWYSRLRGWYLLNSSWYHLHNQIVPLWTRALSQNICHTVPWLLGLQYLPAFGLALISNKWKRLTLNSISGIPECASKNDVYRKKLV